MMTHPTVGVARFDSNVSERLSSLREELPVSTVILLTYRLLLGLLIAHRKVDRVVPTNFFEVMFRMRY